jgi:hypothetical protein
MIKMTMSLNRIEIDQRRKRLGDLDALAASIASRGLLNPLVIAPDRRLISGERRLLAAGRLGLDRLDAVMVDEVTDAAELIKAEGDVERLALLPSEAGMLGLAIERLETPETAAARRRASGMRGGMYAQAHARNLAEPPPERLAAILPTRGSLRSIIGSAVGYGQTTYDRIRRVTHAALDTSDPERQKVAIRALELMDESGVIADGHWLLYAHDHDEDPRMMAARFATKVIPGPEQQRRALTQAEQALSGIQFGLAQINSHYLDPEITSDEAARWLSALVKPRRELDRLIRRLRARTFERNRT